MKRLTVVVTCTDRKSLPVQPELFLRSVPLDLVDRAQEWTRRLDQGLPRKRLRELYQGEAWSLVPRLEEAARIAGFEPHPFVASAGLGLRPLTAEAPAYGATFSVRQLDSVGGSVAQRRAWWDHLNAWNGSAGRLPDSGYYLFVLSRSYADVMAPMVAEVASRRETFVIGGSPTIAPGNRLPADAGLRRVLGGTRGALNMRMAIAWLSQITGGRLNSEQDRMAWSQWAADVGQVERYDRSPLTDHEVKQAISKIRTQEPNISKTRALQVLRRSGYACEQKRFGELFIDVEGETSA